MSEKIATREAYGKALVELGAANEQVVVLDADLAGATMTKYFRDAYPQRLPPRRTPGASQLGLPPLRPYPARSSAPTRPAAPTPRPAAPLRPEAQP